MRRTMFCHWASVSFSDLCQTFTVRSARCRAFLHSQGVPRSLRGMVLIILSILLRISDRYVDLSGSGVQPPAITCLGSGEAIQPATQLRLYSRIEGWFGDVAEAANRFMRAPPSIPGTWLRGKPNMRPVRVSASSRVVHFHGLAWLSSSSGVLGVVAGRGMCVVIVFVCSRVLLTCTSIVYC